MLDYSWVEFVLSCFVAYPPFQAFCWAALGGVYLFGGAAVLNAIAKLRASARRD